MTANVGWNRLDEPFKRGRDLDVSLQEQLRTFAERTSRSTRLSAGFGNMTLAKQLRAAIFTPEFFNPLFTSRSPNAPWY